MLFFLTLYIAFAHIINISVYITEQQPIFSIVFNYNSVNFGTVSKGTTNNRPNPDYTTGYYSVSIDTTYSYVVEAYESPDGTFFPNLLVLKMAVSNNPSVDGTFYQVGYGSMVQTIFTRQVSGRFTGTEYHQYKLDVPQTLNIGEYRTTIYVNYAPI